jgi:hypothetical protein
MSVKISFDRDAVVAKISGINKASIPIIANEALKDANFYAREDTGELIRSSIRASDPDKGLLVWDTPYAKKMYYVGTPHTGKNPQASLMWAMKAAKENIRKYTRMLQAIVDGGR